MESVRWIPMNNEDLSGQARQSLLLGNVTCSLALVDRPVSQRVPVYVPLGWYYYPFCLTLKS